MLIEVVHWTTCRHGAGHVATHGFAPVPSRGGDWSRGVAVAGCCVIWCRIVGSSSQSPAAPKAETKSGSLHPAILPRRHTCSLLCNSIQQMVLREQTTATRLLQMIQQVAF